MRTQAGTFCWHLCICEKVICKGKAKERKHPPHILVTTRLSEWTREINFPRGQWLKQVKILPFLLGILQKFQCPDPSCWWDPYVDIYLHRSMFCSRGEWAACFCVSTMFSAWIDQCGCVCICAWMYRVGIMYKLLVRHVQPHCRLDLAGWSCNSLDFLLYLATCNKHHWHKCRYSKHYQPILKWN